MNKIILPDFIIIPYQLLEDEEITLIDERLYGIIYWFARMKLEKCIASNTTLAKLVKTSPATIANSLTKLEKKEYIKRIFKDQKKKIRSEVIPLVVFSKVSLTDETPIIKVSLTDETVSLTSDTWVSLTDEQKNNNINKKTNRESFDSFWSEYPNKTAKKEAARVWGKIHLTEALVEKILQAVKDHRQSDQWLRDEGKYIPHASTWLNQERWEDEVKKTEITSIDLRTKKHV